MRGMGRFGEALFPEGIKCLCFVHPQRAYTDLIARVLKKYIATINYFVKIVSTRHPYLWVEGFAMRFHSCVVNLIAPLSLLMLVACSDSSEFTQRYQDRWGPDPKMPADEFADIANQQKNLMDKIVAAYTSSLKTDDGIILAAAPANEPNFWLKVTSFGMNVIDQKCDVYMSDLFKLSREHARNDSLLKSIQGTSAALVGGTVDSKNAKVPLLAIASAFGLIESINDEASKTYLFEQIPGIVADKVREARNLYRQQTIPLTSNSGRLESPIYDQATSYRALRDYLALCLPQTIEGNFLQTYIQAQPKVTMASAKAPQQQPAAPTVSDAKPARQNAPANTLNFKVTQ